MNTANQIYKTMAATAQTLPVSEIKAQIVKLMDDMSDTAGTLLQVMLSALENKIPQAEYVEFCNGI